MIVNLAGKIIKNGPLYALLKLCVIISRGHDEGFHQYLSFLKIRPGSSPISMYLEGYQELPRTAAQWFPTINDFPVDISDNKLVLGRETEAKTRRLNSFSPGIPRGYLDIESLSEYPLFIENHEINLVVDTAQHIQNWQKQWWNLKSPISEYLFKSFLGGHHPKSNEFRLGIKPDGGNEIFLFDTGKEYGLQNGCVSNYGCEHYSEDISEFVRAIYVEPDFFTNLIDSKSPKYDIRYRQKLDLLYTHDFISDTQYNKILEVAGVK